MYILILIVISSVLLSIISTIDMRKSLDNKVLVPRYDRGKEAAKLCIYKIDRGVYKKKVPGNSSVDYDSILDDDTDEYFKFIRGE